MVITRSLIGAAAALAVLGIAGVAAAEDAAPDLKDPTVIAAGRVLYLEKHCSHCHGADGKGGINLTRRDLGNAASVFQAIADGREKNGLRMPAWRDVLSDAEIWRATAFVMSIGQKAK